jgi:hypothetical protein
MISRRSFVMAIAAAAVSGNTFAQRVSEVTVYLNPT